MSKPTCEEAHRAFVNLTGLEVPLNMGRIYYWEIWISAGYSVEDLRQVVANIRAGMKSKRRNIGALKFSNLIGNMERWEEELSEARAARNIAVKASRPKPRPTRAQDLTEAGPNTAHPVSESALRILREFRASNT